MILTTADKCTQYICNSTTAEIDKECLNSNGTHIFGCKCKSSQRCPISLISTHSSCINKTIPIVTGLFPGERVVNESECLSGNMKDNICTGLSEGLTCTEISECDAGLICISGSTGTKVCMPAKAEGDQCNNFELYCGVGMHCDKKSLKCQYFGTDKVGTKVGSYNNGIECDSFMVDPKDEWTCINPMKRISGLYANKGDICEYSYVSAVTNATMTFSQSSACGLTKNGSSLCDPNYSSMDNQRKTLVKFLKNNGKIIPCHILSLLPFCGKAKNEVSGFMDAVKAFFDLNIYDYESLYVTTVGVEECFYGMNTLYYFGGASSVPVMAFLLSIIMICL